MDIIQAPFLIPKKSKLVFFLKKMRLLASRYLRRTFGLSRPTPIVRNFTASGPVKGD